MKYVLQNNRWLRELAISATLASFVCGSAHALAPAAAPVGANDTGGQGESGLVLSSSGSDGDQEDSEAAPLQLTAIDDPMAAVGEDQPQTDTNTGAGKAAGDKANASKDRTKEDRSAENRAKQDAARKSVAGEGKKSDPAKAGDRSSRESEAGVASKKPKVDNLLRPSEGVVKALPAGQDGAELSLEDQQARDQGECPGGESSDAAPNRTINDLPLDQEEHPFDAPAAQSEENRLELTDPRVEPPQADAPAVAPIESAAQQALHQRIDRCLAYYFTHPENLAKRSPWAVMHTILPFGVETDIVAGNRRVNAIGWMCYNGVCKSQRMFHPTHSGFRTNVGPGVQGHEGQFLAILAQSSVPRNFPILVGKTRYTVSDLIRYEMVTCREKSELTFKLIGLSHYLSPRQVWRDDRGQAWNLEKVVREELDQPVVGAACGGTHRLMGLSYALMMRRRYKEPINGHWARADVYIKDFVQYAWTLQNPDGSFSTEWFEGRAHEPDNERKVQTTGHILEWLVFTLPAEELADPRVIKAVDFLLSQVYDNRDHDWPIGPRGHALRAIALYNQRAFGVPTGQLKSHLAQVGLVKELR